MDRIWVVQSAIQACNARRYLEIGVSQGDCFLPLRVRHKYAVDPVPEVRWPRILASCLRRPGNLFARVYRMTSDAFFAQKPAWLQQYGLDVVFIDGMHTYEQSLCDVMNSLKYLRPNGVILLHDCAPSSDVEAYPASGHRDAAALRLPGWSGAWSGDVWKTIVHLRSTMESLRVFTLDCDHGIGVVARAPADDMLSYTPAQIASMAYGDLHANRERMLAIRAAEDGLHCLVQACQRSGRQG